jgi:hypothetical protein
MARDILQVQSKIIISYKSKVIRAPLISRNDINMARDILQVRSKIIISY